MIHISRKKNKCIAFLALTAAILLLCTGCVRSGVGVVIEPDDTGTVEISMGINEKYVDVIKEQTGGTDPFAGKNTVALTDGEDRYICIVEQKRFTDLDELEAILLELQYNFDAIEGEGSSTDGAGSEGSPDSALDSEEEIDVWISADGEEISIANDGTSGEISAEENYRIFKTADVTHKATFFRDTYRFAVTTMPHETSTDDLALLGIGGDDMFKLVITVTMPGTVTAEKAEIDENTASFTITDLNEEQVLTAESSAANVSGMVSAGIAVVVLTVILVLVFSRKKPQQNRFE